MPPIAFEDTIEDLALPTFARLQFVVELPQLVEALRGGVDSLVFAFVVVIVPGQVGRARLLEFRAEPFEGEGEEGGAGELGEEFGDGWGWGWDEAGGREGGGGGGGQGGPWCHCFYVEGGWGGCGEGCISNDHWT